MKVKLLIGVGLIVVAALLVFFFGGIEKIESTSTPMPSTTNPNDPAVKGLNLN